MEWAERYPISQETTSSVDIGQFQTSILVQ